MLAGCTPFKGKICFCSKGFKPLSHILLLIYFSCRPGKYGVAKPLYFPFQLSTWINTKKTGQVIYLPNPFFWSLYFMRKRKDCRLLNEFSLIHTYLISKDDFNCFPNNYIILIKKCKDENIHNKRTFNICIES